jgi:hypothetical protein
MCGHLTRRVHATGNQIPPPSHACHTRFALRRLESRLAGRDRLSYIVMVVRPIPELLCDDRCPSPSETHTMRGE